MADTLKSKVAEQVQSALISDEFWAATVETPGVDRITASRSSARETMIRVVPEQGHVRYFLVTVKEMLG